VILVIAYAGESTVRGTVPRALRFQLKFLYYFGVSSR